MGGEIKTGQYEWKVSTDRANNAHVHVCCTHHTFDSNEGHQKTILI